MKDLLTTKVEHIKDVLGHLSFNNMSEENQHIAGQFLLHSTEEIVNDCLSIPQAKEFVEKLYDSLV